MKIKAFHFSLNRTGVQEMAQEILFPRVESNKVPCLICTDVLAINDKNVVLNTESIAISSLIEKWITEELSKNSIGVFQEQDLINVINLANQRLREAPIDGIRSVAVSIVIMTVSGSDSHQDVLIAGVGDSRVYMIHPQKAELVFIDPLNKEIAKTLDPEDRLYALNNGIGVREELKIHCKKFNSDVFQRFVVVPYGFYQQSSEKDIHELGLKPHDNRLGAGKKLRKMKLRGNSIGICTASFGSVKEAKALAGPLSEKPRRQKKRATLGLSVASVAIAVGLLAVALSEESTVPISAYSSVAQGEESLSGDTFAATISSLSNQEVVRANAYWTRENSENEDLLAKRLLQANMEITQKTALLEEIKATAEALSHHCDELTRRNQELSETTQALKARNETLAQYEKQCLKEREKDLEKEKLHTQICETLEQQRLWISRIEKSRDDLALELESIRQQYRVKTPSTMAHAPINAQEQTRSKLAENTLNNKSISPLQPSLATHSSPSSKRVHLVSKGETLSSISSNYYGSSKRWQDIYQANKDSIPDKNKIKEGVALIIP